MRVLFLLLMLSSEALAAPDGQHGFGFLTASIVDVSPERSEQNPQWRVTFEVPPELALVETSFYAHTSITGEERVSFDVSSWTADRHLSVRLPALAISADSDVTINLYAVAAESANRVGATLYLRAKDDGLVPITDEEFRVRDLLILTVETSRTLPGT